jgi:transcriptional regulator of acetoin/glycerol metabolism
MGTAIWQSIDIVADFRQDVAMRPRTPITAEEILGTLSVSRGNLREAADLLGISERTLYRRMAEFGIKPRRSYERVESEAAV